MIELTLTLLRILVVLPVGLALRDLLMSFPWVTEALSGLPGIDQGTALLMISIILVLLPAILGRPGFVVKLVLVVYLVVPVILGTIQNLISAFGVDKSLNFDVHLNLMYLAYMVLAIIFISLLEEVGKKHRVMATWGVEGLDTSLHYQLVAGIIIMMASSVLALLFSRLLSPDMTLPSYSLLAVVIALGPVVALGILPPRSRRTVLILKDTLEIGPFYELQVRQRSGDLEVEIKDSGIRQMREFVHSVEVAEVPENVVVKIGDLKRKLNKTGETVVDGTRYVFYAGRSQRRIKP